MIHITKSKICFICQNRFNIIDNKQETKNTICEECKKIKLTNVKLQLELENFRG